MRGRGANMGIFDKINRAGSLLPRLINEFKKETRTCIKCGEDKELKEFYNSRRKQDNYEERRTTECKKCSREQRVGHYHKNKQKLLDYHMFRNYGLTREDYDKMLDDQGGTCAICNKKNEAKTMNKELRKLSVDHDHDTGEIRGLLCMNCNFGVGNFKDSIEILKKVIKYLEKSNGNVQTTT